MELVRERAGERGTPPAVGVVPELAERVEVLVADLDPGPVAEVALLSLDRQLE